MPICEQLCMCPLEQAQSRPVPYGSPSRVYADKSQSREFSRKSLL